jgi:hypothetical protein
MLYNFFEHLEFHNFEKLIDRNHKIKQGIPLGAAFE